MLAWVVVLVLLLLYISMPGVQGEWRDDSGSDFGIDSGVVSAVGAVGKLQALPLWRVKIVWAQQGELGGGLVGTPRVWRGTLKNSRLIEWDKSVPLVGGFNTRDGYRLWRRQGV